MFDLLFSLFVSAFLIGSLDVPHVLAATPRNRNVLYNHYGADFFLDSGGIVTDINSCVWSILDSNPCPTKILNITQNSQIERQILNITHITRV